VDDRIAEMVKNATISLHESVASKIIDSSEFIPNAPETIRRKGFDHPLFEHGELLNNISWIVTSGADIVTGTVGVFDPELERIALLNEFGDGRRIPSRAFMRKAYDDNVDRILSDLENNILDYLEEVIKT